MSELPGSAAARRILDAMREDYGQVPRLGCELNAHRDLGFCAHCVDMGPVDELVGWRLLAVAERGIVRSSE